MTSTLPTSSDERFCPPSIILFSLDGEPNSIPSPSRRSSSAHLCWLRATQVVHSPQRRRPACRSAQPLPHRPHILPCYRCRAHSSIPPSHSDTLLRQARV